VTPDEATVQSKGTVVTPDEAAVPDKKSWMKRRKKLTNLAFSAGTSIELFFEPGPICQNSTLSRHLPSSVRSAYTVMLLLQYK
jgi:hypothetical protein